MREESPSLQRRPITRRWQHGLSIAPSVYCLSLRVDIQKITVPEWQLKQDELGSRRACSRWRLYAKLHLILTPRPVR